MSAGILTGTYAWRPPLWWLTAWLVFAASAWYLLRRRHHDLLLGWGAMFFLGALLIQVHAPNHPDDGDLLRFTDGADVTITGHVLRAGIPRSEASGEIRQRLDLETEHIHRGNEGCDARGGLRLSVYDRGTSSETVARGPSEDVTDDQARASAGLAQLAPRPVVESARAFHYGERLRFTTRIYAPRNFRNPGAFDYRGYLKQNGISALASAQAGKVELLPGFVGNQAGAWRSYVRESIVQRVHRLWPAREAALMDAMVIGEDAFIDRPTRTEFQRSGTYHVLVVSGMNVSILALVTFWFLKRVRLQDLIAGGLTVGMMLAYAWATALGAPVWRATLMLALYLGGRLLYRERSMLNALGAAALGLLLADPHALFSASFQLTFLCVWLVAGVGIPILERTTQPYAYGLRHPDSVSFDLALPPRVTQVRLDLRMVAGRLRPLLGQRLPLPALARTGRVVLAAAELLTISVIMQIGLALPMAYYFHRATVMGLPANLLVVPLLELLMPAAVLATGLSYISTALARAPALLAGFALRGIADTVRWLGGMSAADLRVPTPGLLAILLAAISMAAGMLLIRKRARLALAGVATLAASALWITTFPPAPQLKAKTLEISAIDVGQGDSILVITPQGRVILVDTGGLPRWVHSDLDIGEDVVSPYLWSRAIRKLDVVAITHAHADHMAGAHAILANFRPRELWLGDDADAGMEPLLRTARELGVRVVPHQAGDQVELGGAKIRFLAPDPASLARGRNDESLVMQVRFGETTALLAGDAERKSEVRIAAEHAEADLLKVAHHGSATSTSPQLLSAVHPRFAVISVGARNGYGHPRMEVLSRLAVAGIRTYRTDLDGLVTFYLDGKTVSPIPGDSR